MAHPAWVRWPIGACAALFTLLVTFEFALAREIARLVIRRDDFHRASRRVSFYARRGWPKLNLSRDMVYVFCNQMQPKDLDALRRFLVRRQSAHPPGLVSCDLAYVSSMKAVALAADPARRAETRAALEQFRRDADQVLAAIAHTPADFPDMPAEKDRSGFDLDRAAEALRDFANEMRDLDQPWFVLSGTFLGIVREGGFLAHDYDIDAGVMSDAVDPAKLREALNATDKFRCGELEWQTVFEADSTGMHVARLPVFMKIAHANGIYIDIFVHHRDAATIWHASSLFRWDNSDFQLSPYRLAGTEVMGPQDADRYLTENYGNWRVPKTEFNSALDTTNQRVVRNPLSVAIFLRRIWLAERSNPAGAAALRRALEIGGFIRPISAGGKPGWQMASLWQDAGSD